MGRAFGRLAPRAATSLAVPAWVRMAAASRVVRKWGWGANRPSVPAPGMAAWAPQSAPPAPAPQGAPPAPAPPPQSAPPQPEGPEPAPLASGARPATTERVETEEIELCLVWAGRISIEGQEQGSADEVAAALTQFGKFSVTADVSSFLQALGAAGNGAQRQPQLDTFLHNSLMAVEGLRPFRAPASLWPRGASPEPNMAPEPGRATGPGPKAQRQEEAEEPALDGLKQLVQRSGRLQGLGRWTMTCPKVTLTVTCARSYSTGAGPPVLIGHTLGLAYGREVGQLTLSEDNWDHEVPARGSAAAAQRLYLHFASLNRGPLGRLTAMARACVLAT